MYTKAEIQDYIADMEAQEAAAKDDARGQGLCGMVYEREGGANGREMVCTETAGHTSGHCNVEQAFIDAGIISDEATLRRNGAIR